jgi:hypothetical protein
MSYWIAAGERLLRDDREAARQQWADLAIYGPGKPCPRPRARHAIQAALDEPTR